MAKSLALVHRYMGDDLRAAQGAPGVRIKPPGDALVVVRMPASWEFDHCASGQCVEAYDAGLGRHCRNLLASVKKRRHVDDEPVVHTECEVEVASLLRPRPHL